MRDDKTDGSDNKKFGVSEVNRGEHRYSRNQKLKLLYKYIY